MLKVGKRHRDGTSACAEAELTDATLKPCFTPPSTPEKKPGERASPAPPASPGFGAASHNSSDDDDDDDNDDDEGSMNDFAAPKRRHVARRRAVLTCARSARIEAAAAAAVDAAVLDGHGVGSPTAVQCPCCGHSVPVPSPQKRRFTLDDIKRAFQAGLQEQSAKDRAEYELRLQQMAREYELELQRVREEFSRPSDYSYFS